MASYVLIRLEDQARLEEREFDEPPEDVSRKGIMWVPVIEERPEPGPDQVVEEPVDTLGPELAIRRRWNVRDLTPAEKDAKFEEQIDGGFGSIGFMAMLDMENRLRSVLKQKPLTEAQYRAALIAKLKANVPG